MIEEKDFFESREDYLGINIAVSKNASLKYKKVKYIIDCLSMIQRIFQNFKIYVPLNNFLNHVVIISGIQDRKWVYNRYKDREGFTQEFSNSWEAFYIRGKKSIFIDINMFRKNFKILKTLVHEIGHAIHRDFITKENTDSNSFSSSYDYWNNLSKKVINLFQMTDDWYIEEDEFENAFYDFLKQCPDSIKLELQNKYKEHLKSFPPKIAGRHVLLNHMPNEYSLTNESEDFAEAFEAFILDNDNLSQHHKNRIINTLTKSRVQGKTVMNAHKDLTLIKRYVKLTLS